MPELPEVQAHAERLTASFRGAVLARFVPFNFTALKTALPRPDEAYGLPLIDVRRQFLPLRDLPRLIAADGIHLTMPGYRQLFDTLAQFILSDGCLTNLPGAADSGEG